MEIKRDVYLDKLIRKKKNGLIKVVTGVRRCGKSYLLFHLFHDHLLDSGVTENHIIEIALDDRSNKELRDPDVILKFIKESIKDKEDYYIILDEVQYLDEFEDVGLRNARLGFRQIEETHLMENIIYNELRVRGYHVDVGVVEYYETKADGKRGKKQLEVDFVATKGSEKDYIQSAFALPTADKVNQEQRGLLRISDFFRKIVVVGDNIKVRRDENGIITIGLRNFLLDENSLKL